MVVTPTSPDDQQQFSGAAHSDSDETLLADEVFVFHGQRKWVIESYLRICE